MKFKVTTSWYNEDKLVLLAKKNGASDLKLQLGKTIDDVVLTGEMDTKAFNEMLDEFDPYGTEYTLV